jgi:penicillin-binding protein 1A
VAGKTGTTNEAKDVWFIGFTSNVVAGCYMGYDNPRGLGPKAFGGTLCVPVFQAFMEEAVKRYGGTAFKLPPGGHFVNIDRYTGEQLPDDATGPNVQAEYFRDGEELVFGAGATVDGGFAMGQDLPVFAPGETSELAQQDLADPAAEPPAPATPAPPADGTEEKAKFGSVSSGGLY